MASLEEQKNPTPKVFNNEVQNILIHKKQQQGIAKIAKQKQVESDRNILKDATRSTQTSAAPYEPGHHICIGFPKDFRLDVFDPGTETQPGSEGGGFFF